MNIERLQLMVTMLREVEAGIWKPTTVSEEFYASGFYTSGIGPSTRIEFDLENWVQRDGCGYVACAVGHACLDQRFGLELVYGQPVQTCGQKQDLPGWGEVNNYFDLDHEDAEYLFRHLEYEKEGIPTNEAGVVADRIEALIRNNP